jgi:hypothetical protein
MAIIYVRYSRLQIQHLNFTVCLLLGWPPYEGLMEVVFLFVVCVYAVYIIRPFSQVL